MIKETAGQQEMQHKRENIYAYRKECYRRPWSNFNAKDVDTSISFKKSFNRFKDIFKQQASKFVNKYIIDKDDDGPSGGRFRLMIETTTISLAFLILMGKKV